MFNTSIGIGSPNETVSDFSNPAHRGHAGGSCSRLIASP